MKTYKLINLMIMLFSITVVFAIDIKEDLTPYIMPKHLTYTSLPDDYDKRIEDYFQYFYQYLMVQDPDKTLMENDLASDEYVNSLSFEDYKKISQSYWILRTHYNSYSSEYSLINSNINDIIDNNLFKHSLVKKLKILSNNMDKKKNTLDCGLSYKVYKKLKLNKKMYFSPTNYLWIVGTITSFEKKDEYHNEFIKLSINVEKALGSELFPEHEIQIVLAYPGRKDFMLKDYGLQESKTYLFALKQCTELHQLSTEERIYSFLSFPSYILEVYDNSISKKIKLFL